MHRILIALVIIFGLMGLSGFSSDQPPGVHYPVSASVTPTASISSSQLYNVPCTFFSGPLVASTLAIPDTVPGGK